MRKPEDLFSNVHRLLKEINAMKRRGVFISESSASVNPRVVIQKAERLAKTWNLVYPEFRSLRSKLRDIFSTYGLQTLSRRGKYDKSSSDLRQVSEGLLMENLKWTGSRFASEFENHVSKQITPLKLLIEEVASAAESAKSLADENLRNRVEELNAAYLPFDLAFSDQLFGSLTNIIRLTESVVDKHMPPEQKLGRLPREGKGKSKYKAEKISRIEKIESHASSAGTSLDTIQSLTSGTKDSVKDLVVSAFSMNQPQQAQARKIAAEDAEDPSLEPAEVPDPTVVRTRRDWIYLSWLNDAEITTAIQL